MATHTLSADTRLEDIAGLASGDTIALAGHVLTCETDMRAIMLSASGTGTIRLLNGGGANFAGYYLSEGITLEAGTSENPLPSHGDGTYPLRSAACVVLLSVANGLNRCNIVSHCADNAARTQFAKVASATSSVITFDRDMGLELGDVIGICPPENDPNIGVATVQSYDSQSNTATISGITRYIPTGSICTLLTSAFCVTCRDSTQMPGFSFYNSIVGDEVGFLGNKYGDSSCFLGEINLKRMVVGGIGYIYAYSPLRGANVDIGVYSSNLCNGPSYIAPLAGSIGDAFCPSLFTGYYNNGSMLARGTTGRGLSVMGGFSSFRPWNVNGRVEMVDCEEPSPLYERMLSTTELVVRTTNPVSCTVHRADGIATLKQRAELSPSIALPDAWLLQQTAGTAWHDEPIVVQPGATLAVQWYVCLLESGATAGVQILDGDNPLFGQVAVGMGVADTLAEYTLPNDTPVEAWQPVKQLTWRNTTGREKKVVLRGWASGGNAYSRITSVPGGVA